MLSDVADSRKRNAALLLAGALGLAAVAWLYRTALEPTNARLLFAHWRTRSIAVGAVLGWLAVASLLCGTWRRGLFLFVINTVVLVLLVVALEAVGRAGLVSFAALFRNGTGEGLGSQLLPNHDSCGEAFEDIASRWGQPTEPISYRYQTNRHGFRNRPDREDADVYLLGDSVLVAGLIPFEETLTARLESKLGVPTMNVALIGIAPQQERDLLQESGLPLEGRLVLQFLFEGNDLFDSARYRGLNQPSAASGSRSFVQNLVLWLQRKTHREHPLASRRRGRLAGADYLFFFTHGLDETIADERREIPEVCAVLREMRAKVTSAGGRYGVVLVPSKLRIVGPLVEWPKGSDLSEYELYVSPLPEDLTRFCAEEDIPLLDLTTTFRREAEAGRIPFFCGDTHPNGIAHKASAETIAKWIPVRRWLEKRTARTQ